MFRRFRYASPDDPRRRAALPGTLLLAFFLGATPAFAQSQPAAEDGWTLPAFELATLGGQTLTAADLRGKVVVLDFWATWCGPCLPDLPAVQTLHDRYADRPDVLVLSVHANWGHASVEEIRQFMQAEGYTFAVGRDEAGEVTSRVAGSIPETLVIDKEGKVRYAPKMSVPVVVAAVRALTD